MLTLTYGTNNKRGCSQLNKQLEVLTLLGAALQLWQFSWSWPHRLILIVFELVLLFGASELPRPLDLDISFLQWSLPLGIFLVQVDFLKIFHEIADYFFL